MNFSLYCNRVGLFAKTMGGKSQLLKFLLKKELHKFNKIYVISLTESVNKFYSDIVPSNCIFGDYQDEWVSDLITKLTQYKSTNTKQYNVLLILDDVINAAHSSKALMKLFCMGRHINISVIMTMQYLHQCPPVCRSNFSFLACGQMNKLSTDLLYDEFLVGNVTKQEFLQMYHQSSKDYNFFIINCNSVKNNDDIDLLYGKIKAD